jgi:hypothetical protein
VDMRLSPKMTPAQIAEAQRMAREWKRLGAPGKSRSERAWDERAAPREGSFARPTEPERGRAVGYRPEHFRPIVAPRTAGVDVNRTLEIAKTLNTRPAPPESCGKENLWVRRGRYFIGSPGCVRSSAWIWLFRRPRRAPVDRRRDRPRRVACRRIRGPWRA